MKISKKFNAGKILMLIFLLSTYVSNAQFTAVPVTAFRGVRTAPLNQAISVGNVPNGLIGLNLIRARLHVNSFFMPASTALNPFGLGNVFRTDGSSTVANIWQMFTGATAATATEKGALYTNVTAGIFSSNDFNIKAPAGALFLETKNSSGNNYHVMIDNVKSYVGIGQFNSLFFHPDMPLHILGDGGNKITNSGWWAGIHLAQHAVVAWDNDGSNSFLIMGFPTFGTDHSFLCGLSPGLGLTSVPNYVYRIVDVPGVGTAPNSGDFEIFHDAIVHQRLGVNTLNPINQVEIKAASGVPYYTWGAGGGTSTSGLRTTNLTSASVVVPNGTNGVDNTKVATVDQNGDWVLVTSAGGGGAFGGVCGTTPVGLSNNWEIPLTTFNYVFSGLGAVGIGTTCIPTAKLDVLNNQFDVGGNFFTNSTFGYNAGVQSWATGSSYQSDGVAGYGNGSGAYSIGIAGYADIFGTSLPTTTSIGIYGAVKEPSHVNSWAGWFDGNVNINGSGFLMGSTPITSDVMFKTNIDTIANPLAILKQLKPITFFLDTTNIYGMNFSGNRQYGFKAQDVQTVLPALVSTTTKPANKDSAGNIIHPAVTYKSLNYNAFFGLYAAAMQKQQTAIDSLTYKYNQLVNCCSANSRTTQNNNDKNTNNIDVELSDADIVVLIQNIPNPFAEQTTIPYNIPKNANAAQILFYDINGRMIKTVDVTKKGKGQLNVYANDLTNGIYSYTLIIDGKIIDTKKMVKQQ